MAWTVTIGGVSKTIQPGWSISAPMNGSRSLKCEVISLDGSYRPAKDQEIILSNGAIVEFAGLIDKVNEVGLGGYGVTPITTKIEAVDYNGYVDRRYVNQDINTGTTLKDALSSLIPYLTEYGVALDPAQVTGPSLQGISFKFVKVRDCLDNFAQATGYAWQITTSKYLRMYVPGTDAAPFNVVDASAAQYVDGDITVESARNNSDTPYANYIQVLAGPPDGIIYKNASDAGEIATIKTWEIVVTAQDITDPTAAQDLADTLLAVHLPRPRTVKYSTFSSGVWPGQTQTITIARRNLNNSFMVTDVQVKNTAGGLVRRSVTLVEGTTYQGNWRDYYKKLSTGSSAVGTVGAYGGIVGRKNVYFLGGSAIEYVQSSGPTWIPASAVQISIDTTIRGTTAASVTVRLRARAGSVTARLRDVTNNATVGTSGAIASTSFQIAVFSVSLTPGSNIYELQLLPSLANTDVAGVGYLE